MTSRGSACAEPQPVASGPQAFPVREDGAYLITGGLGGIGLTVAERLVERGAKHLVLTSRRVPQEAALAAIAELETRGCTVEVLAADVSQAADVQRLMDTIKAPDHAPLRGLIHAAGVGQVTALVALDTDELYRTLAAKVYGGWLLDAQTRDLDLDFFICTSSIASVWGSVMQGAYAAANAFLDGLVAQRRSAGRAATAINYGPWAEVGMADPEGLDWLRSRGIRPLSPTLAIDSMEAVVAAGLTHAVCVDANWSVFRELVELQRPRPVLAYLGSKDRGELSSQPKETALVRELKNVDMTDRLDRLKAVLRRELVAILGRPKEDVQDDTGFFDLGMDSLMAVELRNRLAKQLGRKVPLGAAYEHGTVHLLAAFLLSDIAGLTPHSEPVSGEQQPATSTMASSTSPYTVRFFQPGDKASILALTHEVWNEQVADNMARTWDWKYERNPFNVNGKPFIVVVEHEGAIVATQFGMAGRIKVGSDVYPMQWGTDTQIHPQHKAAGGLLAQYLETSVTDIFMGIPNQEFYAILERTGEVTPVTSFTQYASIVRLAPGLMAKGKDPAKARLFGLCFSPAAALLRLCRPNSGGRALTVTPISSFGREFDQFWETVSHDYDAICVRDAAFLNWRFSQCPSRDYTIYAAHRGMTLAGYVVLHDIDLNGERVGVISDCLTRRHDRKTVRALISRAIQDLEARGVDRIKCVISSGLDDLGRELRRSGLYLRLKVPGGLLNQAGPHQDAVRAAKDWYVTLADSDLDVV